MKKILIIDDDPVSAKVVKRMLEEGKRYDVSVVFGTQEALRATLVDQFDLLLVDWVMPVHSGIEFVRRVRAGMKHRETPVIMLTGQNEADQVREAISVGADGYVLKPPEKERLLRLVALMLDPAQLQELRRRQAAALGSNS